MYPYRSLPENLALFCTGLRRDRGFTIGPGELQDAARALAVTRIEDVRAVRDALRPVLCSTAEHAVVFDAAFDAFFLPRRAHARTPPPSLHPEPAGEQPASRREHTASAQSDEGGPRELESPLSTPEVNPVGLPAALDDAGGEPSAGVMRSSYSPLDAAGPPFDLGPADAAWRAAAAVFVSALRGGHSRRWRPSRRGERFDMRRTLRCSLHTAGEAVIPRWLARPPRRRQLVLLIDGSRSMGAPAQVALTAAVALADVTPAVEVFAFSTALQRLTRDVRRAAAGERRRIDYLRHAWGGGTTIGACLHMFVQRFGERLLGPRTVIIVVSDGLDVGQPEALRRAMGRLHRESAGVIWLNPLLETPGYEPTAAGMSVARPFVSTFASVSSAAGLRRLARTMRLRS
jgi:uncharacterized protein